MKILFSDIGEDDLAECAALYVSVFKGPPWNEEWDVEDAFERLGDFLACPKTIAVKAETEGRMRGFFIGEIQRWIKRNIFYLKEICVAAEMQGQGVGKAMMAKLDNILKENQVSQTYLITQRESGPSKFYSSLEFIENPGIMVMGKDV